MVKNYFKSLLALMALSMSMTVQAEDVVFDFTTNPNEWNLPLSNDSNQTAGVITEPIVKAGVTLSFTDGSTPTRIWQGTAIDLRTYKGGTINVAVDATKHIEAVTFAGKKINFSVTTGTYDNQGNWTGNAKDVTFTVTATCNINTITVSVAEGEAQEDTTHVDPADPTLGTKANPYIVENALTAGAKTGVWVKANIVGFVKGASMQTMLFAASDSITTNIVIAGSAAETDTLKCMPVQLPKGAVRDALNTFENPTMLGKEVLLYGDLATYFKVQGVKNVTCAIVGGTVFGKEPEEKPDTTPTSTAFLDEPFTASQGAFTIEDVVLPEGLTYVWAFDSRYGMKASGYYKQAYAAESWLISPVVDLTAAKTATLTFDHAARYFAKAEEELTLWVKEEGKDWAQLSLSNYPDGTNWNYSAESVSLNDLAGKKIQVAFKYVSTESAAATWEIKNVKIDGEKEADAIRDIQTVKADNAFYTISGMRVATPTKGLYIHNGKRIVIK